jgi:hypothetical protein
MGKRPVGGWFGAPWVVVLVVGAVVLSVGAVWRSSMVDTIAVPAADTRTAALPTGDRLAVSSDAAGRTVMRPSSTGSGPMSRSRSVGAGTCFPPVRLPTAVLARARYDMAPAPATAGPRSAMWTVRVDVLDHGGRPAPAGWADLMNVDDSDSYAAETQIIGGQARVSVPDGHYGGLVSQEAWDGSVLVAAWIVFVEFTVDGGRSR